MKLNSNKGVKDKMSIPFNIYMEKNPHQTGKCSCGHEKSEHKIRKAPKLDSCKKRCGCKLYRSKNGK